MVRAKDKHLAIDERPTPPPGNQRTPLAVVIQHTGNSHAIDKNVPRTGADMIAGQRDWTADSGARRQAVPHPQAGVSAASRRVESRHAGLRRSRAAHCR